MAEFVESLSFQKMVLTSNFRSCQPIVDLCQKLVPLGKDTKSEVKTVQKIPCVCVSFDADQISKLPDWFSTILPKSTAGKNSAIVTRGWSNVAKLRPSIQSGLKNSQMWLATAIHLWNSGDNQSLPEAISLMGRFMAKTYFDGLPRSSRTNYCPDGIDSALEWRLFLAKILDRCKQNSGISNLEDTWINWAKKVREEFSQVVSPAKHDLQSARPDLLSKLATSFDFRALRGAGQNKVVASFRGTVASKADIRITTIHSVKGETLDATMLVSSLDRRGSTDGHWEQWIGDASTEAARLAYVASSRPRHLLVWAVPKLKEAQKEKLTELGFAIQSVERR